MKGEMTMAAMPSLDEGGILHVVQHLCPGGLEVMALELARAQARMRPTMVISLEGDGAFFRQSTNLWRIRIMSARCYMPARRRGWPG